MLSYPYRLAKLTLLGLIIYTPQTKSTFSSSTLKLINEPVKKQNNRALYTKKKRFENVVGITKCRHDIMCTTQLSPGKCHTV